MSDSVNVKAGNGRVAPSLARALAVAALYAIVFMTGGLLSGVDYDEVSESASNVVGFMIIPVGLGILATSGSHSAAARRGTRSQRSASASGAA